MSPSGRAALDDWVTEATGLREVARGHGGLDRLRERTQEPMAEVVAEPQLDVVATTEMLRGLDYLAQTAVQETWKRLRDNGLATAEAAGRADPDDGRFRPFADELRLIVAYEEVARAVRNRRRQAIGIELSTLAAAPDCLPRFIDAAVRPILTRPWRPRLVYEPFDVTDRPVRAHARTWDHWPPPHTVRFSAADALCDGWKAEAMATPPADPFAWIVHRLESVERSAQTDPEPALRARSTLSYLRAGEAVRQALGGDLPVMAPVLFAPSRSGWPIGHVVDALVLPRSLHMYLRTNPAITRIADLRRDSLLRAMAATRDMHPEAYGDLVVLADYPGGGQPAPNAEGESAGLALAAAFVERACGLRWLPNVLATAALSADGGEQGSVSPLRDESSLVVKGRTAALAGASAVVVAADGDDGRWIVAGARQVTPDPTVHLEIRRVARLAEIEHEAPLEDPYRSMLDQLVRDGDEAMAELLRSDAAGSPSGR